MITFPKLLIIVFGISSIGGISYIMRKQYIDNQTNLNSKNQEIIDDESASWIYNPNSGFDKDDPFGKKLKNQEERVVTHSSQSN